MWMLGKFEISESFNNLTLDEWRSASQKVLVSKDCSFLSIRKKRFVVFSIRWLNQVADTFIKLEKYDEADEIYSQIELICLPSTPDYDCFKQDLHCRKESLQFLLDGGKQKIKKANKQSDLSFEEFLRKRGESVTPTAPPKSQPRLASQIAIERTPENPASLQPPSASTSKKSPRKPAAYVPSSSSKVRPKKTVKKDESVIFVDSSDDDEIKNNSKPKKKTASQKSTTKPRKAATTFKSSSDLTPSVSTRSRRMI
jgi:hypothetical protein